MDPLPTGTVTMLFSDIEGSTALLGRLGDLYGEALSVQRRIMRVAIEAWCGREMGTEGDSFFVVFESARQALAACVQVQRALAAAVWPDGAALRVRMGVHTGEPARHEEGYVGLDLNRAARIAATAHGGQVVVSAVTRQLVGSRLPEGVGLADLGWHRLKDINEPEHIFQLTAPDLPAEFPPLRSLGARTSLPLAATPLVGREDELQELQGIVRRPGLRLVTLTGAGGVGKTRLAVALAASMDAAFRDGVFFVPLAAVDNADTMWKALAEAVDAEAAAAAQHAVCRQLAERSALLVLDNLEQLAGAADVIAALLAAAPRLVVVATSRRPMRLQGEYEYAVPPLPGPASPALEDVTASAAVRLFVQQAALVRRNFTLTAANAADVAAICRRLDGLPLAIELSAARSKLLPPKALLTRLGHGLDLAATNIDRPERQQTLRATIAWSHQLLTADLQRVFRRLGVFAGGCDLDAINAVAVDQNVAGVVGDPLEAIGALLDCSLVTVTETAEGDVRIAMLKTIRDYTQEQLEQAGELAAVSWRHAEYYADFVEAAETELTGPRQLIWLDRLEIEHDNLRAALAWTLGRGSPTTGRDQQGAALGLRLVNALRAFWSVHYAHAADGRRWLELAIAQAPTDNSPALAGALHGLGWLLLQQGNAASAKALLQQALSMRRSHGNPLKVSEGLNSLGVVYRNLGQLDVAKRLHEESLAIARSHRGDLLISYGLVNLAFIAMDSGEPERTMVPLDEAVNLATRLEDIYAILWSRTTLAAAMLRTGRPLAANDLMCSLVDDIIRLGDVELTIKALDEFAEAATHLGADQRAARLSGAVDRLREQTGMPRWASDARYMEQALRTARQRTGHDAWEVEYAAGRQLTDGEALALARQPIDAQAHRRDHQSPTTA